MSALCRGVALLSVVVGLSVTGCMTAADEQESAESTDSVSSAVGTCPSTTSEAKLQQSRASYLMKYILGGTIPTGVVPSTSACSAMMNEANGWRIRFAEGKKGTYSYLFFKDATVQSPTTVCGLTTRPVRFTIWTLDGIDNPMFALVNGANLCFGSTIEPFLHVNNGSHSCDSVGNCWSTYDMDPETAQYTATLNTSSGSSASATLLSSNKTTTGYRLPCATCTPYYKSTVPIGAPCSYGTTSVISGTKTDWEAVQPTKMTGYRRCANGTLL